MLISDKGTLVRTRTDDISIVSRNTQGVSLIKVSKGERLVGVERIEEPEEDEFAGLGEDGEVEGEGGVDAAEASTDEAATDDDSSSDSDSEQES